MTLTINPAVERVASPSLQATESWLQTAASGEIQLKLAETVPKFEPAVEMLNYLGTAASDSSTTLYTPVLGLRELREALAAVLSEQYGAEITVPETTITTGGTNAFCMATLAVAGAGDELILPEPFYFNHDPWFTLQGIRRVPLPCRVEAEGMVPDPNEAERLITPRTRGIVLVTPNNPTGTIYSNEHLIALYRLAEQYDLALIVEETYKDFRPKDAAGGDVPPHTLFQESNWRDVLIQLYSFSKAYSLNGYRVGSLVAGPRVIEAISKIAGTETICPPHIGQLAALYALQHLRDWREEKRAHVLGLLEGVDVAFRAHPSTYEVVSKGAFFAYLRHPFNGRSSIDVARMLARDYGLLVLPGEFFGASQGAYLRIAVVNADRGELDEMARRLANSSA